MIITFIHCDIPVQFYKLTVVIVLMERTRTLEQQEHKERTLLKYLGPKKWSDIPTHIKNVPHLGTFKKLYTDYLKVSTDNYT